MEELTKISKLQERVITLKDVYIAFLEGKLNEEWIREQIKKAEKELAKGDTQ